MIPQYTGRKSHFSYKTCISLVLPRDWEEVENPDFAALYVGAGMANPSPQIGINVFQIDNEQPDAYRTVAAMMSHSESSSDSYQLIGQQEHQVDGFPALTQTSQWTEGASDLTLVQKMTVAQVGRRVYIVASAIEASLAKDYFRIFDEVVNSIRFIPLTDL